MTRVPPALAPWVIACWATQRDGAARRRERVLPTGHAHLVLRLEGDPVHVLHASAARTQAQALPAAVLGGPRQHAYLRSVGDAASVGLVLGPGALQRLWALPASALAGQHVPLDALAGAAMRDLPDQLAALDGPEARLGALFRWLAGHLAATEARARGPHPAIVQALRRADGRGVRVAALVRDSGLSHRHFNALFEQATGLPPKAYLRVRRLQATLQQAARCPRMGWAQLALEAGYSEQSHLQRDFKALAGVTPGQWRRAQPAAPNHVPVPLTSGG